MSTAPPTPTYDVPELDPRPPGMHKGMAGRVALIAGSRGMSGAAVLSAQGALRGGAGLVRVCCPQCVQPIVAASEPCLMSVPLAEDSAGRIAYGRLPADFDLTWPTVLAIGPGLGQTPALATFIADLLAQFRGPVIADADALNNVAAMGTGVWRARAGRETVITPHPGEMTRLCSGAGLPDNAGDDDDSRLRTAHAYAVATGVAVVLKGYRTVVCTPSEAFINTTGNPGMATGGMGDVLTGLVAALLAQHLKAFDATRLAVRAHGLAADRCKTQIAPVGYLAREVADLLPAALAETSRPRIGFK